MIIWISGPTGSGKSSLAKVFANLGYGIIHEILPTVEFSEFSQDPKQVCANIQASIMNERVNQWHALSDRNTVAFDRSVSEDIDIFCKLHFENDLLTYGEHESLKSVARLCQETLPLPDLVVYLRPSLAKIKSRITTSTHPPEIINHLERQLKLYDQWRRTISFPVLDIDNSDCPLDLLLSTIGVELC